jgi:hypothetical protein
VKGADGGAVTNPLVRISNQAYALMMRAAIELGLSPAARTKLAASPQQEAIGWHYCSGAIWTPTLGRPLPGRVTSRIFCVISGDLSREAGAAAGRSAGQNQLAPARLTGVNEHALQ